MPDIDVLRYLKSQSAPNFHEKTAWKTSSAKIPTSAESVHASSVCLANKETEICRITQTQNQHSHLAGEGRVGTKQRAEGAQAGHGNQTQSPQEPGSAQGSSVWNVLNRRRLQSCHTLAKLHCYFKRSVYLPYRIYRAHRGMQTPPEICYRSRTKPSPFLTPKNVFHTKAMLLITIFFLKWPTRRVSHAPPIDSNESLMVRTATAFSRTWWVEATSILIGQE